MSLWQNSGTLYILQLIILLSCEVNSVMEEDRKVINLCNRLEQVLRLGLKV